MTKKKSQKTNVPFEASLDDLQQIVHELETGNLSLSDSLKRYEEGMRHLQQCHQTLEAAQKKIELLVKLDETGEVVTRPFDDTATLQQTSKTRREIEIETDTDPLNELEDDNENQLF